MSLFKRLINKIISPAEEKNQDADNQLDKTTFTKDLDYRFAQNFTDAGGFFNYCENEREAILILKQIIDIEGISSTYCHDDNLKNFLDVIKTPHTNLLSPNNDAAFITCEFLVAFNGRIMLSHENIQHYHSSRLPKTTIVIANVSQIIDDQHNALAQVKRRGHTKNITSISGAASHLDNTSNNHTKLFLLLLED